MADQRRRHHRPALGALHRRPAADGEHARGQPRRRRAGRHRQAGAAPLLSGKCPSAFSLDRFKAGQTTRPALVNAYAGRSCTVAEDSFNEDGWTTTVSVNGGAAQSAQTATFALRTGANTVVFRDTWRSPTLPAVSGSGWQRNGDAWVASGLLELNTTNPFSSGSAFWPTVVDPRNATIEFDSTIPQSPNGADGMALVFADATQASTTSVGAPGGRLGFAGIPGIAVALDTYQNTQDPSRYQ